MQHKYTEQEKAFIREYAYGHSYKDIAAECNRRLGSGLRDSQIRAYLKNNKITTGRNGRFEKGHAPINKGTKGMFNVGGNKTSFRKGNSPKNRKPVGTESIRRDKSGWEYIYVKVAEPNRWRMKHVLVWEQHYGPVPKGQVINFLNGDPLHVEIDNLVLVDRATHVRLNQNHLRNENKELTKAGIETAKLITKIAEAKRRL